jgi:hypothetical protein
MSDKSDKSDKNLKKLSVRDFPEELHQWLKLEAVRRKITIGEFLEEICKYWRDNHKSE